MRELVRRLVGTPSGTNSIARSAPPQTSNRFSTIGLRGGRTVAKTLAAANPSAVSGAAEFPIGATALDGITSAPYSVFIDASLLVNGANLVAISSTAAADSDGFWFGLDDGAILSNSAWFRVNNGAATATTDSATGNGLGTSSELYSHRVLFTYDGTSGRMYAQGKLNKTTAAGFAPNADANRQTKIFGRGATVTYVGAASLILAWTRLLSLEEYHELWINPWQLFRSASSIQFAAAAAGGGGGFVKPAGSPGGLAGAGGGLAGRR
jgi:hypothetical protein